MRVISPVLLPTKGPTHSSHGRDLCIGAGGTKLDHHFFSELLGSSVCSIGLSLGGYRLLTLHFWSIGKERERRVHTEHWRLLMVVSKNHKAFAASLASLASLASQTPVSRGEGRFVSSRIPLLGSCLRSNYTSEKACAGFPWAWQ